MDIWLLTFETALVLLLLTATGAALLGKTRRRWLYWPLLTAWLLCWIAGGWWLVVFATSGSRERFVYPTYIEQSAVLASLVTIGGLAIVVAGNRRRDGKLAAGGWSAWRLFFACLVAMMLQAVTFYRVNASIYSELVATRERINRQYAALLKPVANAESNAADLYSQAFAQIKETLAAADSADGRRPGDQPGKASEGLPGPMGPGGGPGGPARTSPSDLISAGNVSDPRIPPIIESLEPAIRTLHAASHRPVCRFSQIDGPPDLMRLMPWLASFRQSAMLLRCHAELEARSGRIDSALGDIAAMRRLARHTSQTDVCLVSGMVAMGVDSAANQALAEILPYSKSIVSLPERAASAESQLREDLRMMVAGEEASFTAAILDFCDGKPSPLSQLVPARMPLAYRTLFMRSDLAGIREICAVANDRIDGRPDTISWGANARPRAGRLGQFLMPPVLGLGDRMYRREQATSRAAAVAVALTNYRIEVGHCPASLDELMPKYLPSIPADPFDGKPMRYRLKEGQATIYSVGENKVDDGGQVGPKDGGPSGRAGDVGLVLKKPVIPANPS